MRIKSVLAHAELVVADVEVVLGDSVRSSLTVCAKVQKDGQTLLVPLNTPDGRPVFVRWENAIVYDPPPAQ